MTLIQGLGGLKSQMTAGLKRCVESGCLTLVGEISSLFGLMMEGIDRMYVNSVVGLMLEFGSQESEELRKMEELRPAGL